MVKLVDFHFFWTITPRPAEIYVPEFKPPHPHFLVVEAIFFD
ncbi:MAG: hypothetical protein ACTSO9_10760 [Candidatus Helarchaeota archaeon]